MPILSAIAVPHPPIILPEIGKGEEAKIEKTHAAYTKAAQFAAQGKPQTVVVISPHADYCAARFQISPGPGAWGDFARFGAPRSEVEVAYDEGLAAAIEEAAGQMGLAASRGPEEKNELDHGTAIPVGYLLRHLGDFAVVRIGLSQLSLEDHYKLGQCIAAAAAEKDVAVVASGDLSHKLLAEGPYGFAPEGPQLDEKITAALAAGDFEALLHMDETLAEKGAECGLRAFVVMAGALDGRSVQAELLSYEGPFGVGYAVATFLPGGEDKKRRYLAMEEAKKLKALREKQEEEDHWVTLARFALESYVGAGVKPKIPSGLPAQMLEEKAGVFVSLHKNAELRGCIGTIQPTTVNVACEIVQNAISAATQDPRFAPVRKEELDYLEINVDVLGKAEPVAGLDELDPRRYGVIVANGGRRGLLLPDLDGIDTAQRQVDIAKQKAGIGPGEEVELERFEVVRHR